MVIAKAVFPQHWRGNYYTKDQIIPATQPQQQRLVLCGRAYYDFQTTFQDVPGGDVLKDHYMAIEQAKDASDEELMEIKGFGKKTLESFREYFD